MAIVIVKPGTHFFPMIADPSHRLDGIVGLFEILLGAFLIARHSSHVRAPRERVARRCNSQGEKACPA